MVQGSYYTYKELQKNAVATGNGSVLEVSSNTTGALLGVGLQVVGITTATITWEGTVDGTNWVAIQVKNRNTGIEGTTATADGLYYAVVHGLLKFRARISSWTTGTITVAALVAA